MDQEEILNDLFDSEWQDVFENMKIQQQNPYAKEFFQYRDNQIFLETTNQKPPQKQDLSQQDPNKESSNSISQQLPIQNQQNEKDDERLKRQHSDSAPLKSSKDSKSEKQQSYSKAYRQKIKQKYKNLEQQNDYLKKRITELQNQIRQQQLELNRLKYSPPGQKLNIEEFSKQYIEASEKWLQQLRIKPPEYFQQLYLDDSQFRQYVIDFWNEKGFCGKKKLRILNYHFNQILQSVLKDSQKYLSLLYVHSQSHDNLSPIPGFQLINKAHMEIYKPEGDLWHKLKQFNVFLKPMSLQLNTHISQFYKKYEDILTCSNKIHEFMRVMYRTSMNVARRRLEMERWFDFYKYGKMVRKLRYQWFNWMKSLAQKQQQQAKQPKKLTKKKKVSL